MQSVDFEEVLDPIVARDARYHRDAYGFLREALDQTQRQVHKAARAANEPNGRHVTGQQLLEGIRSFALERFGPMTLTVFEEWGLHRCEDFGEMVFNLVEHQLLGRTDQDSKDDFKGGYSFQDAFKKPFQPAARPQRTPETEKPAGAAPQ
jgi:uncharacterized repeat protein (TIGR04138 family)